MSILFRHIIRSLAAPALATLALAALPSCSAILDTPDGVCAEEEAADKETGTVVLTLTVGLDDTGDLSRANTADPYTGPYDAQDTYTAGTNYERTVNTINIFLFDANDKGELKISESQNGETVYLCQNINLGAGYEGMEHDPLTYATLPWTSSEQNKWFYARATFDHTTTGTKLIYVAANLSDAMIQSVIQNGPNAEYTISNFDLNAGRAIAGRYFANSEDEDRALTSLDSDGQRGMSFFCTKVGEIEITSLNQEEVYVGPTFHLRRLAAKVHVTCITEDGTYVKTKTDENGEKLFWCKQEDVTYTINTVNKKTYLMQQIPVGAGYAIDPNWSTPFQTTDESNLIYHPMYSWGIFNEYFNKTEVYDANRIPGAENETNTYTKGIYVPENSFNSATFPTYNASNYNSDDNELAEYNISHLIIRAKLTPRVIWLPVGISSVMISAGQLLDDVKQYEDVPEYTVTLTDWKTGQPLKDANGNEIKIFRFTCSKYDDSERILGYDLTYMNYNGIGSDTYYVGSDGEFYSYGAARLKSNNYHRSDAIEGDNTLDFYYKEYDASLAEEERPEKLMEVYSDGISTYRCFLTNQHSSSLPEETMTTTDKNDWNDGHIYRNTYYLVHVSMIGSVGNGLNPNETYIELYTQKIPYRNSWNAEVTITDD